MKTTTTKQTRVGDKQATNNYLQHKNNVTMILFFVVKNDNVDVSIQKSSYLIVWAMLFSSRNDDNDDD